MATDAATHQTTITEGSVTMAVPAGAETAVFYNPVQVQNRDLSVLLIGLAGERQALRRALKAKDKELKQRRREHPDAKYDTTVAEEVEAFRKSLNATELLASLDPHTDGLCILDALAASGLRSLRYWQEIPNVRHVTINDIDPAAAERARENVRRNRLEAHLAAPAATPCDYAVRPPGIHIQTGDALVEMYTSRRAPMPPSSTGYDGAAPSRAPSAESPLFRPQWDVIDLDPYGSAAPFLDAAVQGVVSGGLLCVTCTDMAALGGAHPETCFGRYGAVPIQRAGYLQEAALRILLQALATSAARYGRTIHPLLSVGMDFYIRVFVEVTDDKAGVSRLSLTTGHVYQSVRSPEFHIVPSGQLGGKNGNVYQAGRTPKGMLSGDDHDAVYKIGGPLWLGPLHDADVVEEALRRLERADQLPALKHLTTVDRLRGLLESCREELPDAPLFYKLPELTGAAKLDAIPLATVRAALLNAGYRVSGYHKEPLALKTDAPNQVVMDVLRAWAKAHPPRKAPEAGSFAAHICGSEPSVPISFTTPKGGIGLTRSVARFPQNPTSHWGPKRAASGHKRKAEDTAAVNSN